jgi:hypothetical protein
MSAWTITCPTCGYQGSEVDFDMSLADECFCPNGCDWFSISDDDDEDEDQDDEDISEE